MRTIQFVRMLDNDNYECNRTTICRILEGHTHPILVSFK
jgi:hypothetical protein